MAPGSPVPRIGRRYLWAWGFVIVLLASCACAWAMLRPRSDSSQQDSARLDLLYRAWVEFNAKRYEEASSLLDLRAREVEATPLDSMLRARIAEAQGRPDEAIGHLRRIRDTDPIGAQAQLKLGQIELARHRAGAAEAAYLRSVELDPELLQARRELAYLYALQRRESECDAQFRALAERMPLDYIMAFAWCQNYCRIWDPKGSFDMLKGFVATDPTDRWSRLALATSYELTHKYEEAEETLRALPDSDPDARALRIQLAIDRGQIASAREMAGGGPADHARLNILRGNLAMYAKDPRRAADFYRAALSRAPEERDAIQGLGAALRQVGDPAASKLLEFSSHQDRLKRTILDSVNTIHKDPTLFSKLGELCESVERLPEARVWYRLAVNRDPLDTKAQASLARLNQANVAGESGKADGSGKED